MNNADMSLAKKTPGLIRVLCVDDSADITAMLALCIEREADMESVGSLSAADDLLIEAKRSRADVVLLDVGMPGMDALEMLRKLIAINPPRCGEGDETESKVRPVRVIVFSGHSDQKTVDDAAKAGACGYLSKSVEIPVILEAIRQVAHGEESFRVWG
ncbi:MAG: response regulator transcription factor [Phycisphaeraceae bacterium]|nr:response regulator transcription factor [Phycisphaeraceae bacterium]